MNKIGSILGILGGILGVLVSLITIFFAKFYSGSYGFNIEFPSTELFFSISTIILSIMALITFLHPKVDSLILISFSLLGAFLCESAVGNCLTLSLIGGILILLSPPQSDKNTPQTENAGATKMTKEGRKTK